MRRLITSQGSPFSIALGRFQVHGTLSQPLVAQEVTKARGADLAAADVLVAIDARAELALAVVEVNRDQPARPSKSSNCRQNARYALRSRMS